MAVLPEYMSRNPEGWLSRINYRLGAWGNAPEATLEAAYEAARTKLPCTGSGGFRPCANCNELSLQCGRAEAPHFYGTKSSALGRRLEEVMAYPDGRQVITRYPLEEGDYDPETITEDT